jgi:hydrogenase nickel incorporation protein HypB
MCVECGCGLSAPTRINGIPAEEVNSPLAEVDTPHVHAHDHDHGHTHDHDHTHREVAVHTSLFAANDAMAMRNRAFFQAQGTFVINVVSAPGSGKTYLLTKTIERLAGRVRAGVIVGDLETDNDAQRLRATGAPVVQITTGTLCHLDAQMIARASGALAVDGLDLLIIENVGNLVCPADFDLGENLRVALLSVTEGEDKPLKYPPLFRFADVVVVSKIDLAGAVEFEREAAIANIRRINPKARIFELSARKDEGMEAWCDFLAQVCKKVPS